ALEDQITDLSGVETVTYSSKEEELSSLIDSFVSLSSKVGIDLYIMVKLLICSFIDLYLLSKSSELLNTTFESI
ncbi:hypothetical protein P6709_19770, partial [Jeotgalibacillus sp. ET6]|nr:hypothetical protein [Jeotgalibacillus sp. ET6]